MIAAVVNASTALVENIIVADAATDAAPTGCVLIDVTSQPCGIGWTYWPSGPWFIGPATVSVTAPLPNASGTATA